MPIVMCRKTEFKCPMHDKRYIDIMSGILSITLCIIYT